jgi:pimeloyl-ACP methyl ester carboxylesterase
MMASKACSLVEHRWCDNGGVRLHILDSRDGRARTATPVLVMPGWPEPAYEYARLASRPVYWRVVIVDVRRRGRSGAPERGSPERDGCHAAIAK